MTSELSIHTGSGSADGWYGGGGYTYGILGSVSKDTAVESLSCLTAIVTTSGTVTPAIYTYPGSVLVATGPAVSVSQANTKYVAALSASYTLTAGTEYVVGFYVNVSSGGIGTYSGGDANTYTLASDTSYQWTDGAFGLLKTTTASGGASYPGTLDASKELAVFLNISTASSNVSCFDGTSWISSPYYVYDGSAWVQNSPQVF